MCFLVEAKKSGIEDILVVTGKGKRPIEDHFDSVPELEQNLKEKGKTDLLRLVEQTTDINLYLFSTSHYNHSGNAWAPKINYTSVTQIYKL